MRRNINCILLIYISKLETYEFDVIFYYRLETIFGVKMPMMVSDAFVVKSCGRVEAWTLTLHISYIVDMGLVWTLNNLYVKF